MEIKNETVIDLLDDHDDEVTVLTSSSSSKQSFVKIVCLQPYLESRSYDPCNSVLPIAVLINSKLTFYHYLLTGKYRFNSDLLCMC